MSWSVDFMGHPNRIVEELKKEANNYSDQSRTEYEASLPHLIGLVLQNYNNEKGNEKNPELQPTLHLVAHGSGYARGDGQIVANSVFVQLQPIYTKTCF